MIKSKEKVGIHTVYEAKTLAEAIKSVQTHARKIKSLRLARLAGAQELVEMLHNFEIVNNYVPMRNVSIFFPKAKISNGLIPRLMTNSDGQIDHVAHPLPVDQQWDADAFRIVAIYEAVPKKK